MFFPEGQLRVHLYGQPCDMRRSFDGLSAMVRHELRADPCDGSLYCFINRRATQMRVLYFDRSGFCVWAKRLEAGAGDGFHRSEDAARGHRAGARAQTLSVATCVARPSSKHFMNHPRSATVSRCHKRSA